MIPDTFPVCVIECKHHRVADIDACIRVKPTAANILGWWQQVLEDAQRCTDETGMEPMPILIYKGNGLPPRISFLSRFMEHMDVSIDTIAVSRAGHPKFTIMDLMDFTKTVSYEQFKQSYLSFTAACNTPA
jgi:hypothetical protein